ncbi:MAG: 2-amino-4-hydroxy-6-hydroxymethyldihydropteridine diphosphokinase, partial [Polymorphobacter sp.]
MTATILIAIGSNRRHVRHGRPEGVVRAAVRAVAAAGLPVAAVSRIRSTARAESRASNPLAITASPRKSTR